MPTEIMDGYLETLEENERYVVGILVEPFEHTALILANITIREEQLLTREVNLGPVSLFVTGRTKSELEEAEQNVRSKKERILTHMANEEFEAEFLAEDSPCILPEVNKLRDLTKEFPVFGLLIADHDENCMACELASEKDFDEREEARANFVATIDVANQQFLVDHAQRVFESILARTLPSEKVDLLSNELGLTMAVLCGDACHIARSFTAEYLMWMTGYTPFLQNPINHATGCKETYDVLSAFEREQVALLPRRERALYQIEALVLNDGDGSFLFD